MTGPYQGQYPSSPPQHQPYPQQAQDSPYPPYSQDPRQQPYPQPAPPPGAAPQYGQQYPQPQPQYPGQGPADGQPAIVVNAMYMWLAFMLSFFKPKIFVNGQEFPAAWGRNVIPVAPGQHHVHVHVPYLLPSKIGPADATVSVQPGQPPVDLEYRAPVFAFASGSLGAPPQQYNGMGVMIGLTVGLFVVFCLCCGVTTLLG